MCLSNCRVFSDVSDWDGSVSSLSKPAVGNGGQGILGILRLPDSTAAIGPESTF